MMTLSIFKSRVIAVAMLLELHGKPTDLASVIYWDADWSYKWSLALEGVYDA